MLHRPGELLCGQDVQGSVLVTSAARLQNAVANFVEVRGVVRIRCLMTILHAPLVWACAKLHVVEIEAVRVGVKLQATLCFAAASESHPCRIGKRPCRSCRRPVGWPTIEVLGFETALKQALGHLRRFLD